MIDLTTNMDIKSTYYRSRSGLTFEVPIIIQDSRIIVCRWMRAITVFTIEIASPRGAKLSRNMWRSLMSILMVKRYYDHLRAMNKDAVMLLYDESNDAAAYLVTLYDRKPIDINIALHMIHHARYMIIDSYEYTIIPSSSIVAYEPMYVFDIDDLLRQYRSESEHFD